MLLLNYWGVGEGVSGCARVGVRGVVVAVGRSRYSISNLCLRMAYLESFWQPASVVLYVVSVHERRASPSANEKDFGHSRYDFAVRI